MEFAQLAIPGVFAATPKVFPDSRGSFHEWFRPDLLAEHIGHHMMVRQANHSISRRGTVRGIHFADVPIGQAKFVYCPQGAVIDIVVDIRVGSPNFGTWLAIRLDDENKVGLYIPEGLGHAFIALRDDTSFMYLCSASYNPGHEHGISPDDPDLGIRWADFAGGEMLLSEKDLAAPSLAEARDAGLLPDFAVCEQFYASLRAGESG